MHLSKMPSEIGGESVRVIRKRRDRENCGSSTSSVESPWCRMSVDRYRVPGLAVAAVQTPNANQRDSEVALQSLYRNARSSLETCASAFVSTSSRSETDCGIDLGVKCVRAEDIVCRRCRVSPGMAPGDFGNRQTLIKVHFVSVIQVMVNVEKDGKDGDGRERPRTLDAS